MEIWIACITARIEARFRIVHIYFAGQWIALNSNLLKEQRDYQLRS
jgi:hypothetical protein